MQKEGILTKPAKMTSLHFTHKKNKGFEKLSEHDQMKKGVTEVSESVWEMAGASDVELKFSIRKLPLTSEVSSTKPGDAIPITIVAKEVKAEPRIPTGRKLLVILHSMYK